MTQNVFFLCLNIALTFFYLPEVGVQIKKKKKKTQKAEFVTAG
jgi:hypothetical protein